MTSIFGEPGQGAHAARLLGLAAVDVYGTLIMALAVVGVWRLTTSKDFGWRGALARWAIALVILVALGMALHWAFRVDTALNVALFGRWR